MNEFKGLSGEEGVGRYNWMIANVNIRNMVRVLVAVCNGSEEIETVTPVDVLRRAGAEVTLAASGESLLVTMSRGIKLQADSLLSSHVSEDWDMIVVPGGPGASTLRDDPNLTSLLTRQKSSDKWIASICASPVVVLKPHGILEGLNATCYPSLATDLPNRLPDRVVTDHHLITSQGPATSLDFSLELVKVLLGEETRNEVAQKVLSPN